MCHTTNTAFARIEIKHVFLTLREFFDPHPDSESQLNTAVMSANDPRFHISHMSNVCCVHRQPDCHMCSESHLKTPATDFSREKKN